jgi:6-phosphogluconolactonase
MRHSGKSVNAVRQEAPHAHSINLDAGNRFAFVADLGLDQVLIYRFDPNAATLAPHDPPYASVAAGAGPRHFAFHPQGKFAYVINELANTITVFAYDPRRGALREIQTISTLPADFTGTSYTAEVVAHPSGKFVYGSNRGHDSIAAFAVNAATGELAARGNTPCGGKTPRNFNVTPDGRFLLAAGQDSNSVCVFRVDLETGALAQVGVPADVPKPVCVKFVPYNLQRPRL